jgi:aminocarboxymuconate-semialdehyde decarboxylase
MQGSEKVCFGTDYPFPLGDLEFGKFIHDSKISQVDQENIFANATLSWLKLDKSLFM